MKIKNIGNLILSINEMKCHPGETIEVSEKDGTHLCEHHDFESVKIKKKNKPKKIEIKEESEL